jgi:predicted  nucleic acid-binding Zn-ribbon protein
MNMDTHTCANCGNTFVMEHDVRGCPVCVGGESMSLSDLLVGEMDYEGAPHIYDDLQTIMRMNSDGEVTIQVPGTTTEWITSTHVMEARQ